MSVFCLLGVLSFERWRITARGVPYATITLAEIGLLSKIVGRYAVPLAGAPLHPDFGSSRAAAGLAARRSTDRYRDERALPDPPPPRSFRLWANARRRFGDGLAKGCIRHGGSHDRSIGSGATRIPACTVGRGGDGSMDSVGGGGGRREIPTARRCVWISANASAPGPIERASPRRGAAQTFRELLSQDDQDSRPASARIPTWTPQGRALRSSRLLRLRYPWSPVSRSASTARIAGEADARRTVFSRNPLR